MWLCYCSFSTVFLLLRLDCPWCWPLNDLKEGAFLFQPFPSSSRLIANFSCFFTLVLTVSLNRDFVFLCCAFRCGGLIVFRFELAGLLPGWSLSVSFCSGSSWLLNSRGLTLACSFELAFYVCWIWINYPGLCCLLTCFEIRGLLQIGAAMIRGVSPPTTWLLLSFSGLSPLVVMVVVPPELKT